MGEGGTVNTGPKWYCFPALDATRSGLDEEQQRKLFRDVDEMQTMVDTSLNFFRDDSEHEPSTRFNLSELVNTVADEFRGVGNDVSFQSSESVRHKAPIWCKLLPLFEANRLGVRPPM
ncbi:hypothetical protein [Luteibacter sp. 22Crub2.1]|uniref:hypothetical protein n=1 Tax=Luteibacter sp. 22Crub2.1 TaxID=1283288 RepID=UPI0009A6FA75|nr:hypothetical protein [Luteibacter sp. 22Crub2.1]